MSKAKTLTASSKNTSFESSSHYEDINVTSKEYAANAGDCCSDGGRKVAYPKVLPDFPAPGQCAVPKADRRLSLPPPPAAGVGEGATRIPPPPPPRVSSTLGRRKDATMVAVPFARRMRPDAVPEEEHKSPVVPCVPNKVCPAAPSPAKKPVVEPRVVIKASPAQHQTQDRQQRQQQPPKRTNIPRVVHPQNSADRVVVVVGVEGDTGTVKRKKK